MYLCTSVILLEERRFSIWEVATNQQNSFETNEGISCLITQTQCRLGKLVYSISSHTQGESPTKSLIWCCRIYPSFLQLPVTFSHLFGLDVKKLPNAQNCAPENVQPWPAPSCYSLPATLADSVALHLGLVNGCRRSRVCAG